MYLNDIVASQKGGEAVGIPSVCSAHPIVLEQALEALRHPLIEATCNQVNQFGGYTGMTPDAFVRFIRGIAQQEKVPFEEIILGGDHLGPHVWKGEAAVDAMAKARVMIADYARAGFTKLHLDCSMQLGDDPKDALDMNVAARRAAELASEAERSAPAPVCYVIGTEVPRPGGAVSNAERAEVTRVEDVAETIDVHRKAFSDAGLESAWERVIAVVVQPGVEFGDDFVMAYQPDAARGLSTFIEGQPFVYEAHSTDYQTPAALKAVVGDHFAILKVGPALTFAYREAVFALAMIENECTPADRRSNLIQVVEDTMTAQPEHWKEYYQGTAQEQAFKRKYSLSDRIRYYWTLPEIQGALDKLMRNLEEGPLPYSLSSQFLGETGLTARQAVRWKIQRVLTDYAAACGDTA